MLNSCCAAVLLSGFIMQAASFPDNKTKDIVLALFCLWLHCLSSNSFHVIGECFSLGQLRILFLYCTQKKRQLTVFRHV